MTPRQRLRIRTPPRVNPNRYASLHSLAVGNFRSEGKRVPVKSSMCKRCLCYISEVTGEQNEMTVEQSRTGPADYFPELQISDLLKFPLSDFGLYILRSV